MKILSRSSEIRSEIIKLFSSSKGRRVAIAAFVGEGAEAYLPKPTGIHLICWPKAGGTNPNVLRRLMKLGVSISFVDSLHMKLYWAEDKGIIITSANLSTNALGAGSLKEIGVLLPKGVIEIDELISKLRPRPVSVSELRTLDRLHKLYLIRNRDDFRASGLRAQSFEDWYDSAHKVEWRLGWWDLLEYSASQSAKAICKKEYGVPEPHWAQVCTRRQFKKGDWILSFRLNANNVSSATWMFVDYVVNLTTKEKRSAGCSCEAVQIWSPNRYPERPFLIDSRFRRALAQAVREYGANKLQNERSALPKEPLLDLIYARYLNG
jgi:hypothetical protein